MFLTRIRFKLENAVSVAEKKADMMIRPTIAATIAILPVSIMGKNHSKFKIFLIITYHTRGQNASEDSVNIKIGKFWAKEKTPKRGSEDSKT